MKKTTIIISSLIILAGVIFYSCKKDDTYKNNKVSNSKSNNLKSTSENPFEWVGLYHNEALDYVIQNASPEIFKSGNDEIIVHEIKKKLIEFDNITNTLGAYIPIDLDKESVINNMLKSIDFRKLDYENIIVHCTQDEQPFINKLDIILSDTSLDKKNFISLIDNMVLDINNSSKLNDDQKAIMLMTIAVGKHSWLYWHIQLDLCEKSSWFVYQNTEKGVVPQWYTNYKNKLKKFVKADAYGARDGAIGGAVIGALGGSWAPGPGTMTGAISGAVVGAATGAAIGSVLNGL